MKNSIIETLQCGKNKIERNMNWVEVDFSLDCWHKRNDGNGFWESA